MKITRILIWHVPLTSTSPITWRMARPVTVSKPSFSRWKRIKGLRMGRGLPDPALPACLRARRGPCAAGDGTGSFGANPIGPEALMARLDHHLQGHPYAKSAIDIALWDLTGQAAGLPLYALLGGRRSATMPLYHSITCVAPHEMARIAQTAQQQGIAQFQVKLGADADWQQMLSACGRCVRPSVRVRWSMVIGIVGRPRWMQRASAARCPIWTSCWNNPALRLRIAPVSVPRLACDEAGRECS